MLPTISNRLGTPSKSGGELPEVNLPEGYEQLNYVTANEYTYIQTDVYVSNRLGVEAKASRTYPFGLNGESDSKYVLNARSLGDGQGVDNRYGVPRIKHDGASIDMSFGPKIEIPMEEPYVLGTPYTSSINLYNSGEAVWNGEVLHTFEHSQFPPDKWCGKPLALLGFTNDDGVYGGYRWIGGFYYALFTLDNEIYRYFVPVLKTSSGRAKIYEVIERKIYEPVEGVFSSWG